MKYVSIFALSVLSYVTTVSFAGFAEGRFAPVVSDVAITRSEAASNIRTRIWGEFRKVRMCDFHDIEFRLGDAGAYTIADVVFEEGAKVRGEGWEDFGPWLVQLDASQLANRSYALVYHQCYLFGVIPRPWLTVTEFLPVPG